jgi:signal transduction histidine kinase/DNA-binding NarL/FixJ family response regulator
VSPQPPTAEKPSTSNARAQSYFAGHWRDICRHVDHLFAGLLVFQWLSSLAIAWWISPRAWSDPGLATHPHVDTAISLGSAIVVIPLVLTLLRPGAILTRHVVALSQMLMGALLIHLTGGRLETHFHVFGSLAILTFYRDWRVLVTASVAVVLEHVLRAMLWPQSGDALLAGASWRWVEYVGWIAVLDIILMRSCVLALREMQATSEKQAALEETSETIEQVVVERRSVLQASEELRSAKEAAESANCAKTQFLANMSHEFRTPMAAIVGYAEMLIDPWLSADERGRTVQAILRNSRHLVTLINDILDLAKIEAGRMVVEQIPCRLWQTVAGAMSVAEVAAQEKGLDLHLIAQGRLPRTLVTDPTRLRQVLDNLLSNAIKFTDSGKRIELRLRLDMTQPARGSLVIEVEDQGIGIPAEAFARIFQPFTQADPSTTRRYGGTGLGLSICKHLIETLGGALTLRSTPGVGTCFTVTLPVDRESLNGLIDATQFMQESHPLRPRIDGVTRKLIGQVLLAEDSPDNRNILRFFLERAGLVVETAENGLLAVEKAKDSGFDLILMDMQMPELDGYAATSILRQKNYTRPIVALTAHAMAGDEEKCFRAGCNGYLTKPVDTELLLRIVARYLPSRSRVVTLPGAAKAVAPSAPAISTPPAGPADSPSLAELTEAYRRSLPEKVKGLTDALHAGDLEGLSGLAHRLRGSAGMYGWTKMSELAGQLEEACHAGEHVTQLTALVAGLSEEERKASAQS